MSDTENSIAQPVRPDAVVARREDVDEYGWEFDFTAAASWVRKHSVLVAGLVLVLAEIVWKAQFLSHMYFSQDDYVNLDIAIKSPFDWHYLTLIGAGHLYPGLRAVTWVLARASLYDWGLDAGLALTLVAAASLAALRLLRTLFGERPGILIPLAVYCLTPLTVPDLGWWWCAMESLPLQLAIFMMLNAHVHYIRTGRSRHLAAAVGWLVVGMIFFEKGIVLAPLAFALTAAFLMGTRSWAAGAIATLRKHWRAWVTYAVLMLGYAIFFLTALRASGQQAHVPSSLSATGSFAETMLKDTLVTGALGGPWRWLPLPDGLQALASPPGSMAWFALMVVIAVLAVSMLMRPIAWRAWAILAGWVVIADMLPVAFGRLYGGLEGFLGLETRYLVDASCVLAICIGLAFLPVVSSGAAVAEVRQESLPSPRARSLLALIGGQNLRYGGALVVALFVVGSIWSVQAYENSTPGGAAARAYIANVKRAVALAPSDTSVLNQYMPGQLVEGLFGKQYASESSVIGDLAQGKHAGKFHWVGKADGTIDSLRIFGNDGKLYPAVISGDYSVARPGTGFQACWPERHGRITVRLEHVTTAYDWTLHFAYIWGGPAATVVVEYGGVSRELSVLPKVHNAYLPVSGDVSSFVVLGLGVNHMCVAAAQSGDLVPFGTPIQ
jgi:hypothetical protein